MLKLIVRNSAGHIEATSDEPFEPREADAIRRKLGRAMESKCLMYFLERVVNDPRAPNQITGSDINTDFEWRYTGRDKHFKLIVRILVKKGVWHTAIFSAQAEECFA